MPQYLICLEQPRQGAKQLCSFLGREQPLGDGLLVGADCLAHARAHPGQQVRHLVVLLVRLEQLRELFSARADVDLWIMRVTG